MKIIKKALAILLSIVVGVAFMPSFIYSPNIVHASEDSEAPVLNSFKILNSSVERPGVVQIQLDITEEDAGFSDFSLSLSWTDGGTEKSGSISTGLEYGGAGGDMCSNFALAIDSSNSQFGEYTGTYIFNLYVGASANVSDYEITQLWIRDKEGNTNSYENSDLSSIADSGNIKFSITGDNSNEDRIAPVLTGYEILTPSVSRPGVMKIALDIFEEGEGMSDFSMSLSWTKGSTEQNGSISMGLEYGGAGGDMCSNFTLSIDPSSMQFGDKTGTYIFDLEIAEKANISEYSITELWIRDKAGNEVSYTLGSLTSLATKGDNKFSLTGDAGTDDITAPVINSYEILNPIVNRPGVLKFKLNITEEGSGLSDIDISLSWTKNGTPQSGSISMGLEYGGAGGDMCSNFDFYNDNNYKNLGGKSGSYIFTLLIGEKADISTYSIDRIWIRDKFGNTSEIANDSMISYSVTGSNTFDLQDEFNYSFTTGTNNPNLPQRLIDMPIGSAAKVEITGDNILRKECLDAIKGTDKTIVAYSNSIQWIIRGNQLTGETKDLRLDVVVSALNGGDYFADTGSTDTSYTVSDDAVKLDFYSNGVLPGKIQVRFKSDALYDKGISGSVLSLYYFDGSNLTFENDDFDLSFDGTDKWCYVNITHNSTFVVSASSGFGLSFKENKGNSKQNKTDYNNTNNKTNKGNSSNKNKSVKKYKNEWVDGKWYDANGKNTYSGTLKWKKNSKGWWVEDTKGWYPQNQWQKIDGIWYFFEPDGYMASNEYYDGYWFNSDGSWDSQYYLTWKCNSKGWWVEDKSGWWPANKWLKVDGDWYYFNGSGYMATSQYVDGWWVGANGVCQ